MIENPNANIAALPINQVITGDCLEVMREWPDKCIDLILTDPPYGIGVRYGDNYDDKRKDYWEWLNDRLSECIRTGKTVVFTHRQKALRLIPEPDWIGVWNKPGSFGSRIGNSAILPHWEPIIMYGIHGAGTKSQYTSDVFTYNPEIAGGNGEIGREKWESNNNAPHPCPKPLHLMKKLLVSFEQIGGGLVLDPFAGSGTTLVAAKQLGRRYIGIEIEPKYVAICNERLRQTEMAL